MVTPQAALTLISLSQVGRGTLNWFGSPSPFLGYRVHTSPVMHSQPGLIPPSPPTLREAASRLEKGGTGFKVPLFSSAAARQRGDVGGSIPFLYQRRDF